MKAKRERFGTGGCYACGDCKRLTRSTGRGDNENCGLCAECFDRISTENTMSDCGETPELLADWERLLEASRELGGNPSYAKWWQ